MAVQTGTFLWLFFAVFFVEVKSTTKQTGTLKILDPNREYYEGPMEAIIQKMVAYSDVNNDESDEKNGSSGIPDLISDSLGRDFKRQFDPWGGKRSSYNGLEEPDVTFASKRQFSPWGGKRGLPESEFLDESKNEDEDEEKNSYGDKRNFHPWVGKRKFNSWGGKRPGNLDVKRNFNAWGGKRSFNSWGGKRSFNSWGGKKSFNAWGGKRQNVAEYPDEISWNSKKSFNSWGGKRNTAIPQRTLTSSQHANEAH